MITHFCPACWQEIAGAERVCPFCGSDLAHDSEQSFEAKLINALEHPVPERRLLAIQILGELGSQAALPAFEILFSSDEQDIYVLRAALLAMRKIEGNRSQALIERAAGHPFALVRHVVVEILKKSTVSQRTSMHTSETGPKPCTFILVRHGQTAWNRVERFRGRADVPLDETGLAQAEATGWRVAAEWQPAAVYASPLSRAVKTAEAIARHFSLSVQAHSGLVDINYGEWQGLAPDEVTQRWPEQAFNWYNRPELAQIPGGESLADLSTRARQTLSKLAALHAGETVVLVGHTVINRVILLIVLGLGNERFWHLKQETCAINVFEAHQDDFVLVSMNDTCHLRAVNLD
jgi:phosphoserine phosphatase